MLLYVAVANRLVAQGSFALRDVSVPLEPVDAHVMHVSVLSLPPYVSEEALVQALSPYGRVQAITYTTFREHPDLKTGKSRRVTSVRPARPHVVTGVASLATPPLAARRPACGVAAATRPPTARNGRRTPQQRSCPETFCPLLRGPLPSKDIPSRPTVPRKAPTFPSFDVSHLRLPSTQSPAHRRKRFSKTPPVSNISLDAAATFGSPTADSDDLSSNSDRLVYSTSILPGGVQVHGTRPWRVRKPTLFQAGRDASDRYLQALQPRQSCSIPFAAQQLSGSRVPAGGINPRLRIA
ncbi:hypothetical protein HPB47_012000 [Ixodes persulcatus]|uniref:Uncharacterized protein n=1 Tax=Ixodes persulcatus TaxID=34615 RepID=A0AC60NUP7_IXOPE|nr:hypothetical protein HPB47_012000 [Ixodes persulcatus]